MRPPPRSRAKYEGMLLVQYVDEEGETSIGFSTETALASRAPNETKRSYLVIGKMRAGRVVNDEGRDDPIEKWLGGEWRK